MAEYIRRLVDRDLAGIGTEADPNSIIGLFDSGGSDIAKERPAATGAAIAEWAERKSI